MTRAQAVFIPDCPLLAFSFSSVANGHVQEGLDIHPLLCVGDVLTFPYLFSSVISSVSLVSTISAEYGNINL